MLTLMYEQIVFMKDSLYISVLISNWNQMIR
jgi:hypothetical protein